MSNCPTGLEICDTESAFCGGNPEDQEGNRNDILKMFYLISSDGESVLGSSDSESVLSTVVAVER